MGSVFSHIIQKWFSGRNEDIATEALAYILQDNDAREAMMSLLNGIVSGLPPLRFETQETRRGEADEASGEAGARQGKGTDSQIRLDMVGRHGDRAHVFVENKFWAGFTRNQPVPYLKELAACAKPALLLVIAPEKRGLTLQRVLTRRLSDAGLLSQPSEAPRDGGRPWSTATNIGPVLALTSWRVVLDVLEQKAGHDPRIRGDIAQLRALCDAADDDAFTPVQAEEVSNQRTPALILQLGSLVQATVNAGVNKGVCSTEELTQSLDWTRTGRYVWVGAGRNCGGWIGVDLTLWKSAGETPIWLTFDSRGSPGFGRAREVRELAARHNVQTVAHGRGAVAIPLHVPVGLEKEAVVDGLVERLREIASVLAELPPAEP